MSHYLQDNTWLGRDEMKATHYEVSPREREDEQVRDFHDFDGPHEDGHSFMPGIDRHHIARLTERGNSDKGKAPGASGQRSTPAREFPRSVNPDKEAA